MMHRVEYGNAGAIHSPGGAEPNLEGLTIPTPEHGGFHASTRWRLLPSTGYDALCFLNALTGDPYYVPLYEKEYRMFAGRMTASVRQSLASLSRLKQEHGWILSAAFCLLFSAGEGDASDGSLDAFIRTSQNPELLWKGLEMTGYYSAEMHRQFDELATGYLPAVLQWLSDAGFEGFWNSAILPQISQRIAGILEHLSASNIVPQVESHLGFPLFSDEITAYMLYFAKPHGIRITGLRFITDIEYPFEIVVRNAIHEMMHPPYDSGDAELRRALQLFREDPFVVGQFEVKGRRAGYSTFESFIEENCVDALDVHIGGKVGAGVDPVRYFRDHDDGMDAFGIPLFVAMQEDSYTGRGTTFRDYLMELIRTGRLAPGKMEGLYRRFLGESTLM